MTTNQQNQNLKAPAKLPARPLGTSPVEVDPVEAATGFLKASHAPLARVSVTENPLEVEASALIVATGIDSDDKLAVRQTGLPGDVVAAISKALASMGATGRANEIVSFPAPQGVAARMVVAAGTGRFEDQPHPDAPAVANGPLEALRDAVATAVRSLRPVLKSQKYVSKVNVVLATPAREPEQLKVALLGALVGDYNFTRYTGIVGAEISHVHVTSALDEADAQRAITTATTIARGVREARALVNTTPRDLFPAVFAEIATRLGEEAGCEVEVLDEEQLAEGGYGSLLGVGQGSIHPPRLVRVTWDGTGKEDADEIALVGKGITFDSGGLSLKPPLSMETMQSDMAGAAAVLQIPLAAAALGLKVRVSAWLTLAENMPSGSAQRPSDVVIARDGTSIQVLNTDAEGRLALADAMIAAREFAGKRLSLLVDVATLTGAQIIALGDRVAGVMGTPAARERVVQAANAAGEPMWPAPLPTYLRGQLDCPIATMKNKGKREGGMLTAGVFLQHFAGDGEWAHIDIAGPSYNEGSPRGITPTGGTGCTVPTLLWLVRDAAARADEEASEPEAERADAQGADAKEAEKTEGN